MGAPPTPCSLPTLLTFSPALLPRAPDWGPHVAVTGPLTLEQARAFVAKTQAAAAATASFGSSIGAGSGITASAGAVSASSASLPASSSTEGDSASTVSPPTSRGSSACSSRAQSVGRLSSCGGSSGSLVLPGRAAAVGVAAEPAGEMSEEEGEAEVAVVDGAAVGKPPHADPADTAATTYTPPAELKDFLDAGVRGWWLLIVGGT